MKVCVSYRVCQHWRSPAFQRLSNLPDWDLKVFHSTGVPGTKVRNGNNLTGFNHETLYTIAGNLRSSGRRSPFVFCPTLLFKLLSYRPDVILAEGGGNLFNNFSLYFFQKLKHTPIVWWTLGEIPGRKFSGTGKIYRTIVTYMEKEASALLGYSTVAMQYFSRCGYPAEKCFKAVNVVDTDNIIKNLRHYAAQAPVIKGKHNLKNTTILFVGALIPEKRIDRLIRAMRIITDAIPSATLLIVGDGVDKARLSHIAEIESKRSRIIFTGEVVENVGAYFQAGDLFILPGLGGLAISEAMAHSLPVICTRGDGCEVDLVEQGVNGYRINEDQPDEEIVKSIANHAINIFKNPMKRRGMGEKSREVIDTKYNINTYIETIKSAVEHAYHHKKR